MRSHRTIWGIAGLALCLAVFAFVIRRARDDHEQEERSVNPAEQERDQLTAAMLEGLRKDPRVRRPDTRALVETAARYAESEALATGEAFYALGLWEYYGVRDFEAAEAAYTRAVELRPEWSWPYSGLGTVWFARGYEEEGLKWFAQAIELDPGWSRPHSDLAILYRRMGRMGEAEEEAEHALEVEPDNAINHFNYAVILDSMQRYEEARSRYMRALELGPGLSPAIYNLACSYAREGGVDHALQYLLEAIELDEAFREEARTDPDFDLIREHPEFVDVTGGGNG